MLNEDAMRVVRKLMYDLQATGQPIEPRHVEHAIVTYVTSLSNKNVERLQETFLGQVELALSYALDEKPSNAKLIPSVFELQVGHLKDKAIELFEITQAQAATTHQLRLQLEFMDVLVRKLGARLDRALHPHNHGVERFRTVTAHLRYVLERLTERITFEPAEETKPEMFCDSGGPIHKGTWNDVDEGLQCEHCKKIVRNYTYG